jgi:hypothetical protein
LYLYSFPALAEVAYTPSLVVRLLTRGDGPCQGAADIARSGDCENVSMNEDVPVFNMHED